MPELLITNRRGETFSVLYSKRDQTIIDNYNWVVCKKVKYNRVCTAKKINGKWSSIPLSRTIMNPPDNMVVDHINHNTLDNRRRNLRVITSQQNIWNSRSLRKSFSRYKGVGKNQNNPLKFISIITINGKPIHIGSYPTEEVAAIAYDYMAIRLFGEYACLNFPKGVPDEVLDKTSWKKNSDLIDILIDQSFYGELSPSYPSQT